VHTSHLGDYQYKQQILHLYTGRRLAILGGGSRVLLAKNMDDLPNLHTVRMLQLTTDHGNSKLSELCTCCEQRNISYEEEEDLDEDALLLAFHSVLDAQ
jgi:hypothetical protein